MTVVTLIAVGTCLWGLKSFKTESASHPPFGGQYPHSQKLRRIEDRMAGIIPLDVIVRFDRESQQQLKFLQRRDLVCQIQTAIKKLPDVSGSLSLADFLPAIVNPAIGPMSGNAANTVPLRETSKRR